MAAAVKLNVGLSMLSDARTGEFRDAYATLNKLLTNVTTSPGETKFRTLKTSNAKIQSLLQTKGTKAFLIGAGFQDNGDILHIPIGQTNDQHAEEALALLKDLAEKKQKEEQDRFAAEVEARKAREKENNEKRKLERIQIGLDNAARKEPDWRPKAAGVKGGRDIVSCKDIGADGRNG